MRQEIDAEILVKEQRKHLAPDRSGVFVDRHSIDAGALDQCLHSPLFEAELAIEFPKELRILQGLR